MAFTASPALAQIIENPLAVEKPAEAENERDIATESNPAEDAAIARRLREIYANFDALDGIDVEVNSGVVTLSGELLTMVAQEQAVNLAERVEGVVGVENRLERVYDIRVRLDYVMQQLRGRSYDLIANLPLLLIAMGVVVFFWLLSAALSRWDTPFERFTRNPFLIDLLKQIGRAVLLLLGLLLALEILDATALWGAIVGVLGLVGLAIGFAIRDTVENYITSILLSLRQPFAPNDFIDIAGIEGKVVRLTSRATILMNFDGNHIRIPNATVYKSAIINYTRNPERRFGFDVGVDTEVDLSAARALAIKTLLGTPGVIPVPAPICIVKSLGDSNVVLSAYAWTDQSRYDILKVCSAGIQAVKEAFDEEGFEMPEPIYRLRIKDSANLLGGSGAAESQRRSGKEMQQDSGMPRGDRASLRAVIEQTPGLNDVAKDELLDRKIAKESAESADILSTNAPQE